MPIPYFVLTAEDTYLKQEIPYYFTGLVISSIERELTDKGEPVWMHKFTAYYSAQG